MNGMRIVVAACVLHRGVETHSTTVTLEFDKSASFFEVNGAVREQAARQMLYCNNPQPSEVIVLNFEDITFGLADA